MLAAMTTAAMAAMARWSRVGLRAQRPGASSALAVPLHGGRRHRRASRTPTTTTPRATTLTEEAAAAGATLRLLREVTAETEVKRSRFVARAAPVTSPEEAMDFVRRRGDPAASHNCFAYRIGHEYRFSDDGEPGGTAGRPMLSALEGSGFDGVCVLVTRYYGGTQLGAGGLVRAYGGAASAVLENAPGELAFPTVTCTAIAPDASHVDAVYRCLARFDAVKEDEEYSDDGSVYVELSVDRAKTDELGATLADLTQGKVAFRVLDD